MANATADARQLNVSFKPATADDLVILGQWMTRPHWRAHWGDPVIELGYVRDMISGRDETCRPFIFSLDDEPSGYIQVWQIGPHQTPEWAADNPWLMQVPSDAVGVDLSLADDASLGRGIGSSVLRAFVAMLRAEGHRTIIVDPDPNNARAVAAYRRAGFRPMATVTLGTEDALIMEHHIDMDQR